MQNRILYETETVIINLCKKHYNEFHKPLEQGLKLRDDIGLDSIDLVVLQIELEDRFGIRFDPLTDDFSKIFCSIDSLCRYIEIKIGETDDG